VTEDILAKGIMKLFVDGPSQNRDNNSAAPKLKSTAPIGNTTGLGAQPGSLRRVFLMRDRYSNDSWRYGFAEFTTLDDSQAAMTKFRASSKFTIASKNVNVGFVHTGVFIPSPEAKGSSTRFSFSPVYNRDILLKYWDDRVYPSIHNVNLADDLAPVSPRDVDSPDKGDAAMSHATPDGKKSKKPKDREKDKSLAMAPQMQMWARKRAELQGQKGLVPVDSDGSHAGSLDRRTAGLRAPHWRDTYTSYADWDTLHCLLCDKKFPTTQELRDHEILTEAHTAYLDDEEKKENATAKLSEAGKHPETVIRRRPRDRTEAALEYTSYADADALHCLVCQRRFKALATLRLHERESELHRKSMTNERNVDRAVEQLAALGRQPTRMRPAAAGVQYRDRARERRVAFNQPRKPGHPPPAKKRKEDRPAEATPKKTAAPSKGASLLGKMGWTAGQGLGAEGTGRTEAIATDLYVQGVGLGAEGGKVGDAAAEAAKATSGSSYANFVEDAKRKAKERYERMAE
jgi:RNA-binding protein 5/10